jgi:hypothetical protein
MPEDKNQEFETVDITALPDEELDDIVGGANPSSKTPPPE